VPDAYRCRLAAVWLEPAVLGSGLDLRVGLCHHSFAAPLADHLPAGFSIQTRQRRQFNQAAKLRDTPGEWSTDKNVGAEFRTSAVS
jgi:hypothetical protein